MPLTLQEFRAAVEADLKSPPKLCGCGCGEPLEPRFDGERHKMMVGETMVEVNSDCYFESFGTELEEYPIGPGVTRSTGGGL